MRSASCRYNWWTWDGIAKVIVTRRYSIVSKWTERTVCGRSGLPNSYNVTFSVRNTPVHRWHWPPNFCLSAIRFFNRLCTRRKIYGQNRVVLESRSESILAADVVSCHKTTVQAGTELSCGDLWFSLFRWKSIYVKIYMKGFAISMREFREIALERSHFR